MSEISSSTNAPSESSNVSDFSQVFYIEVEIKKAIGLIKADTFGKSDPYVVAGAFGKNYVTKTIMKTLDPVWNEKTQFCFFNDPKELHFQLFDFDNGTKDDPIGDVKLSLKGFWEKEHKGFDGTLNLENVKKGQICVSVKGRKLLPIKLETEAKRLQELNETQINEMNDQNNQLTTLTNENEQLTQANENNRIQIDRLTSMKESLEDEKSELENEQKTLENEIKQLETEKSELETKLKELETSEKNLQASVDKASDELEELKTENRDLESQISKIKSQISDKESEYKRLQEELEEEKNKPKESPKKESPKQETKDESPNKPILDNKGSNVPQQAEAGADTQCCGCVVL